MPLGTGTTNGLTTPPDVATFTTLSSLLASPPAGRATALDAPGSDLYAVGGKWGGDPGVFTSTADPNYVAYLAAIAAGSVYPAPSVLIGPAPATAVAMKWNGLGYSIDGFPTFASTTERNAVYASVLPPYVGYPAYISQGSGLPPLLTTWAGTVNTNWNTPSLRNNFSVIREAINAGSSAVLNIIGDSTGANIYTWSGLLAQKLAEKSRVEYFTLTNNATPGLADYGAPTVYGGGTRRGLLLGGQRGRAQRRTTVGNWTSDLDVRVEAQVADWGLGTQQCFAARSGVASASWNFGIHYRTLRLTLIQSGTLVSENLQSSASVPFASGDTGWVRFTFTSGLVKFYTSTNGVTWTQLGTDRVCTTTVINTASLCDYSIGSMNGLDNGGAGASQCLTGTLYSAEIRDGINGPVLTAHGMDAWDEQAGDLNTLIGSPTIYVFNGSISGATLAYLSPRLTKIVRRNLVGCWIINAGKNESMGASFVADMGAAIATIKTLSGYNGYVKNQYPNYTPANFINRMTVKAMMCGSIAKSNNIAIIDSFQNFLNYGPTWPTLLEPADGLHATAAGCLVDVQSVIPLIC